ESGASSCTTAQSGWYASGTGSTSETQCGQGSYSSAGSSSCTTCPAGSYCNSNTNGAPTLCPVGTYSSSTGTGQMCINCPAGTFNNVAGSTGCCSCCSGWYNDQTGQGHCFNCPNVGSFQQGSSPAGATDKGQCVASAGALGSCSQGGDGSCPPVGGSSPSSRKRQVITQRFKCDEPGQQRCPIWRGAFTQTVKYECLDVLGDLESCGGCVDDPSNGEPSADGGRDCTAIPHVD
ncbi:hypothetical protein JAAARDRAFT_84913, partial [Jaapia argillacea MUCL 33604]